MTPILSISVRNLVFMGIKGISRIQLEIDPPVPGVLEIDPPVPGVLYQKETISVS
jgi:hypothetical protein